VDQQLIDRAKDLTALVIPGSLLMGVSWLSGICWALGLSAFGFISVADIARSALMAVPVCVAGMAALLIAHSAFPILRYSLKKPAYSAALHLRILRFFFIFFIITFALGWVLLSPEYFYSMLPYYSFMLLMPTGNYVIALGQESKLSRFKEILTVALGTCLALTIISLGHTGMSIAKAKYEASESICIRDDCKDGTVIKRFSDATYIRWLNDDHLSIVLNNEVTSLSAKMPRPVDPIIDTRPYFRRFWTWLTA
jgi:hypothetical protein